MPANYSYGRKWELMAIQHKEYPAYGVQFHPESIPYTTGKDLLSKIPDLMKRS